VNFFLKKGNIPSQIPCVLETNLPESEKKLKKKKIATIA
jgi:hypothetical protein